MIYSGYVTFATGWRSPSLMSRDTILSVKLEHPHGSIERARKRPGYNGGGDGGCGVSFLFLSLSLSRLLWQMGNTSKRGVESRGMRGKEKTTG
jgi:hypothetical protein